MSSPAPMPPITPVPPPPQPRSYAGPVLLVMVGTMLLLTTTGVWSPKNFGIWFARYWPALIILWGVAKLYDYYQAQRAGLRPRGIGAGGVFLLIFFITMGMGATQFSRVNWGELGPHFGIDGEDFPMFGHTYTYDDTLTQAFPAGGTLHVVSDRGAVDVTTSEDGQIHVSVHKRINADNQQDADKWNASTKPTINVSDKTLNLNANTQAAGDHWVSTDLQVSLPRKASVIISTRRGDINLMGRDGDAEISNQNGEVSATDINGNVKLSLEHGSARVSQVSGDVTVEGRGDNVSVTDAKGTVRINGDFQETIQLAKIGKTLSFKSSRTEMEFAKLTGDLDLDSGDLRASGVVGPLKITTRSKDIRLTDVIGDVRVQDENGSVEMHFTKPGNVQVDNRQSDIQIYLPDKAAFQLDARTRNGEIETDFDQLKVNSTDDQASVSGSVGTGGPHLVINNEHGGIEVRKGSSMADAPMPPTPPRSPKKPAPPDETEN